MMRAKIDETLLRKMINDRKTSGEICAAFGVTVSSLSKFRQAHGIPRPIRTYNGRPATPQPEATLVTTAAKPVPHLDPRTAGLIATGGRYASLRDWAAAWGVSEVKARQEWHKLGLPIAKGGSA